MPTPLFNLNKPREIKPAVPSRGNEMKPANNNDAAQYNVEIIKELEFVELRDFIYDKCGIFFTDSKKYLLEGRIKKRLIEHSMKTFREYLNFIKSPGSNQEINTLMDIITINETYFFRAEQQFEAVETKILQEIIESKGNNNQFINIWSAASSSGEEAYTLAMIINEKIRPKYPNINFRIIGSDINREVLDSARTGIYGEYSIRHTPKEYLLKYFKLKDGKYHLSEDIKKMVKFIQLNLFDEKAVKSMNFIDMIFCANVLIYFDIASKEKVVSLLYNSLNRGGYFFIGCSESLHGISKAFKLIHFHNAMAYKKE